MECIQNSQIIITLKMKKMNKKKNENYFFILFALVGLQ